MHLCIKRNAYIYCIGDGRSFLDHPPPVLLLPIHHHNLRNHQKINIFKKREWMDGCKEKLSKHNTA